MPVQRLISALAVVLMATVAGCSGGGESGSPATTTNAQIASSGPTPVFRNLGKREESNLPPLPKQPR